MGKASAAVRSPAQNSRMWGLVAELQRLSGLSRDDAETNLRAKIREISGQEHSSRLTTDQMNRLLAFLDGEVARYRAAATPPAAGKNTAPPREPWGARGPGTREARKITAEQQRMIAGLFAQRGWRDLAQQRAFVQRQCKGLPWPQTMEQADAIIEPLKAMVLREVKPEELWSQVKTLRKSGHPFTSYEAGFLREVDENFARATTAQQSKVLTTKGLLKLAEIQGKVAMAAGSGS